jgi:outer membrane beta-barrel protein
MNITKDKSWKRLLSVVAAGFAFFGLTERAEAQEILLTGPLAGAPAVRKLRLYREGRFEIAPSVSFTLLDEYQRTILLGARLTYNLTDWFGIGAWGAYGALIQIPTSLTDHIQEVNQQRRAEAGYGDSVTGLILAPNLGTDLEDQIGGIDWVAAPQLTFTPFRGKIALFQSIYVDTDLYISAGPAFISVKERKNCKKGACSTPAAFDQASRTAIAPTAALGLTFYAAKWAAIGVEYRALPFAWNKGGFDTAGGGKDKEFPDGQINEDDRRFGLTNMITLSFNAYLPTQYRVSE